MSKGAASLLDFDPAMSVTEAKTIGEQTGDFELFERLVAWDLINNKYKTKFENGDKAKLIETLLECAQSTLPIPDWAAAELKSKLWAWLCGEAASIEAALGLKAAQKDIKNMRKGHRMREFAIREYYRLRKEDGLSGGKKSLAMEEVVRRFGFPASTIEAEYLKWIKKTGRVAPPLKEDSVQKRTINKGKTRQKTRKSNT